MRMLRRFAALKKDPAETFGDELKLLDLIGFFCGKYFYKPSDT